jgi:hypothetical protein
MIRDLVLNHNLSSSSTVIFGGASAGGRGAMALVDLFVSSRVFPPGSEVFAFLDSPYWLDAKPLTSGFPGFMFEEQSKFSLMNTTAVDHGPCRAHFQSLGESVARCQLGEYRMPFLKTPYFLIASQYDSFQLGTNIGLSPPFDSLAEAYALSFGAKTQSLLLSLASASNGGIASTNPRRAVYSWTCFNHAVSDSGQFFSAFTSGGVSQAAALAAFLSSSSAGQTALQWIDKCGMDGCGSCAASAGSKQSGARDSGYHSWLTTIISTSLLSLSLSLSLVAAGYWWWTRRAGRVARTRGVLYSELSSTQAPFSSSSSSSSSSSTSSTSSAAKLATTTLVLIGGGGGSSGGRAEGAKIGVSFSPAGLLTPFHLGAAQRLGQLGYIDSTTSLAGSSGGALAAATTALNIDPYESVASCCRIASRCRDAGTFRTLGVTLREELQDMLPDDAAAVLDRRPGSTQIAFLELLPEFATPRLVTSFSSKQDLQEVLMASCGIPFYLTGSPAQPVRGAWGVDGFLAVPRSRFGCPETGASDLEIVVMPFDPQAVGFSPNSVTSGYLTGRRSVVISPALLGARWPFSLPQLFQLALGPPLSPSKSSLSPSSSSTSAAAASDTEIESSYSSLFKAGAECVDAWAAAGGAVFY